MSDYSCLSPKSPTKYCKLTLLLLDCWQREYDKRPYCHFEFERLKFEKRMGRNYDPIEDFNIIVLFLTRRFQCSIKLVGLSVMADDDNSLIEDFVKSLRKIRHMELKLMDLPTEFFKALASNAKAMKIEELSLEGTPLNDNDIDYLHTFVIESNTLCKLNVASCNINQYNFARVADAIYKSPTLNSFNISHILGLHLTLDSDKVAHILASLVWQNKLQELILENCGFIGQDMEIIGEYLYEKCCKLQTLNVSYNKIGANGALELLKAISSSGTLRHLKMNGCSLGTHGGEGVAQYLSHCRCLESLAIQHNNIGAEAINMVLLCMKKPCQLQKLHLFGNCFNKRTGDTLRRLLLANVLSQDCTDVTVTFDDTIAAHRVIPWFAE